MDENLKKMAAETSDAAAEVINILEKRALKLGLNNDPSIWFSFIVNTLCMAMGAELECELRGMTYGSLLEQMDEETHNLIVDNARKVSKFGFEEVISKRHPGAVRIVIDPEKKP